MPAACSHDKTASVTSIPSSMGPVATLNKNSVGICDLDVCTAAVSGSFLLLSDSRGCFGFALWMKETCVYCDNNVLCIPIVPVYKNLRFLD